MNSERLTPNVILNIQFNDHKNKFNYENIIIKKNY